MTSERGNEYGVQPAPWGKGLVVGRLNKGRTRFLDKDESEGTTSMVVGAVASWVERHFDGSAVIEIGGKRVTIEVTDIEPAAAEPEPQATGSDR